MNKRKRLPSSVGPQGQPEAAPGSCLQLLTISALLLALAGCGQKGSLTPQPKPAASAAASAPA